MKKPLAYLDSIQFDHTRWLNELVFAHKEIDIYQKRLEQLVTENTDTEKDEELMEMFEHFENTNHQVTDIHNNIKKHILANVQKVRGNGSLKAMVNSEHQETRKMMEDFRKKYVALKKTFHRFSTLQD